MGQVNGGFYQHHLILYTQAKNKTWKQRKSKPERFLARSEFKLTIIQAHTQSMRTRSIRSRPELSIGPLKCDRISAVRSKKREEKREFVEESRARRVCLLFRPSSIDFPCISWTKMFTEKQESVNFEVNVCWAVNFHFFPTLLKSMKNSTCPSGILWHFQAQASTWCLIGRAVSQWIKHVQWSANFEMRERGFSKS